jgi:hypothetical protein
MFRCFSSYRGWLVLGLAVMAGSYFAIWHGAHVAALLPFLIVLACPLMHLLGHGGHGHHPKHTQSPVSSDRHSSSEGS